ncbi:MAG: pyridoxal-phosphate dependent enzyme, partial [Chloroflexi bacterium]|nr:pyridoxal-phosphate dependent enzyme [Chloroflexota bacterium]
MPHTMLRCSECQHYHLPDMKTLGCERCGAPLDVEYIGDGGEQSGIRPPGWTGPAIPLPVHTSDAFVTLGEGGTPCVSLNGISKELGLENLVAKLEFMNPTGSFKDRGTSIMMSVASEQGVREIVEDSSGNAGASVSAYAAKAGIRAHIFAPATAPEAKLQQIKVYGAQT